MNADCVASPYGPVVAAALQNLKSSYDTRLLLHSLREFDEALAHLNSDNGPRDGLARVYCMTASVLSGAVAVVPPQDGDIHTVRAALQEDLEALIALLRKVVDVLQPLRQLQP